MLLYSMIRTSNLYSSCKKTIYSSTTTLEICLIHSQIHMTLASYGKPLPRMTKTCLLLCDEPPCVKSSCFSDQQESSRPNQESHLPDSHKALIESRRMPVYHKKKFFACHFLVLRGIEPEPHCYTFAIDLRDLTRKSDKP